MNLNKSVVVDCRSEQALRFFTEFAAKWWPPALRQTEGWNFEVRTIFTQGRFYERDAKGREVELGKILLWDAPHQLQFELFVLTGREYPTWLTIHFAPEGAAHTKVTLEHRPTPASAHLWEKHAAAFNAAWEAGMSKLAQAVRDNVLNRGAGVLLMTVT